jgi:serine/threonine protein phosphatase PrpC
MVIQSAGKTDIGLVRKLNEDYYKIDDDRQLYIVCDGMGGHNAGEVASFTAAEMVSGLYGNHFDELVEDEALNLPRMLPPTADVLTKAVRIANHHVFRRAQADEGLSGMGTTIVACALQDDILSVLHVGDSRVYRLFEDTLTPLTTDHSWVTELEQQGGVSAEDAKALVNRNVITRALGVKDKVDIDIAIRRVVDGDVYILCSDGLCGFAEDDEIETAVRECDGNINKIVDTLVQMANERGGADNVTVIALSVSGKVGESEFSEILPITIEGEPDEYFVGEEEWAEKVVLDPVPQDGGQEGKVSGGSKGRSLATAAAIIVFLFIVFYFVFRG